MANMGAWGGGAMAMAIAMAMAMLELSNTNEGGRDWSHVGS